MKKSKSFSLLKYNKFDKFGGQVVHQFILFEWKYLFSIIFFYFEKSDSSQDRFHTHAFDALSIKLFGSYEEHILKNEKTGSFVKEERNSIFKWFPKNHFHRIAKSKGCLTILLSGPWETKWKEFKDGIITNYKWGRV